MIIDCHTHIASHKVIPEQFVHGMCSNIVKNMPYQPEPLQVERIENFMKGLISQDEGCELLISEMDSAGIDKSILLIIDVSANVSSSFEDLLSVYDMHRSVLEKYPGRFVVFAGVDPRRGAQGLSLFEQSIKEWGFKGLKLYPPFGFSPSDESLFPYYEMCSNYKIPVLLHTGPTSPSLSFKFTSPNLIDEAAFLFPGVNFILGHAAFMLYEQGALLAEYRPNIYLDVSGFTNAFRLEKFEQILSEHKKRGILNKILFGTDWPIHRLSGSQKDLTGLFRKSAEKLLTEEEMDRIFYKNITQIVTI